MLIDDAVKESLNGLAQRQVFLDNRPYSVFSNGTGLIAYDHEGTMISDIKMLEKLANIINENDNGRPRHTWEPSLVGNLSLHKPDDFIIGTEIEICAGPRNLLGNKGSVVNFHTYEDGLVGLVVSLNNMGSRTFIFYSHSLEKKNCDCHERVMTLKRDGELVVIFSHDQESDSKTFRQPKERQETEEILDISDNAKSAFRKVKI